MKAIRVLFVLCFAVCFIFVLLFLQSPETNLVNAFFSSIGNNQNYVSKLSNVANNRINIIIESNNAEDNDEIKTTIENELHKLNNNNEETEKIINIYGKYPSVFLAPETRRLLKDKDYKTIEDNSLKLLYGPLGLYIASIEKDPYLFATDFVLNIQKYMFQDKVTKDGKVYDILSFECKNGKDVKAVKDIADRFNLTTSSKVYITGIPIHTYETQKRSSIEINIFCILSVIMLIVLCRKFFGSLKIIVPVSLSIIFGMLFGFTFSALIFKKLHILTFVFSTSLIGISLDYSFHYFVSGQNKELKKSLSISLLSTLITFGLLYFSGIEVLKQISIFVSFGLIGVYLFVCLILPLFKISFTAVPLKTIPIENYKKVIYFFISIIIAGSFFVLKFDDNIKNLYNPSKKLLRSEIIYKNLFNDKPVNYIIVKGDNLEDVLEKEENIAQELNNKGIKFLALSSFVSSAKKQKENIELVRKLYKSRLNDYANFLNDKAKSELMKEQKIYPVEEFPLNSKFMPDKNTSFITVFSNVPEYKTYNVTSEMNNILKNFRYKCLKIIPFIFLLLVFVLRIFYKFNRTIKVVIPSFIGGIFALSVANIIFGGLNVFHLLAFILSLGFSMDYSIFRIQGGKNSSSAIFISCISTVFSFLLLSFAGFKLISSLGIVLSCGIFTSYILSLLLISPEKETENI